MVGREEIAWKYQKGVHGGSVRRDADVSFGDAPNSCKGTSEMIKSSISWGRDTDFFRHNY